MTRNEDHLKDINRRCAEIILHHCFTGEITQVIATAALEALEIRGGFEGQSYTGYDYRTQQWITWNA